jgi:hypothetical protein
MEAIQRAVEWSRDNGTNLELTSFISSPIRTTRRKYKVKGARFIESKSKERSEMLSYLDHNLLFDITY